MTRYNMKKANGMGEVYSRVNRLAHQLAVIEEMRLRGAIIAQVLEARDKGADTNQLKLLLNSLETASKLIP